MKIKISVENKQKIESALKAVNGKASSHTYTKFTEIDDLARSAERWLDKKLLPKSERQGAVAKAESGKGLPNSYKYSRVVTGVTIERGSKDWFIVRIVSLDRGSRNEQFDIILTQNQDMLVVEKLRQQYTVS